VKTRLISHSVYYWFYLTSINNCIIYFNLKVKCLLRKPRRPRNKSKKKKVLPYLHAFYLNPAIEKLEEEKRIQDELDRKKEEEENKKRSIEDEKRRVEEEKRRQEEEKRLFEERVTHISLDFFT
jgi:hypothetical protein